MIQLIIGVLLLLNPAVNDTTEEFEGTISLKQSSRYNTYYYDYYIKGNHVRVDKHCKTCKVLESYLVNMDEMAVYAIDHERKMYMRQTHIEFRRAADSVEIIKSENAKVINGFTCYLWRVRNRAENTEFAFWVTDETPVYQYTKVGEMLKHIDKAHYYFSLIPERSEFLPVEIIERNLVRRERIRGELVTIETQPLDEALFVIPDSYRMIAR